MVSLHFSSGLQPAHQVVVRRIHRPPPLISSSCFRFSSELTSCDLVWNYPQLSNLRPYFPRRRPPSGIRCGAEKNYLDNHHEHYHHQHHHGLEHVGGLSLNRFQNAIFRFAKVVGWADLADLLRDNLQLCCCSVAMLLLSTACHYLLPASAAKLLQDAFISITFPLTGVSAALDAALIIAGGKINIHVLMVLAAFASVFMGNSLEGALLLAMFNLAHIAEAYFTRRSKFDVKKLKDSHPEYALKLDFSEDTIPQFSNLNYNKIPVNQLDVGSYILVRAGEAVPVDGEVFHGASTITIEHLTGEGKPVDRQVGDTIPGGARNLDGMMIVKTTKSWEDSTLNKIIQLTEEGQLSKPKLQKWLDEFGEQYSKVVVALSLIVALIGPFIFKWPFIGSSGSIYRALGLMVAASPCALAAAPLAYATAISSCANKGILLKGGHVLDAIAACQTVAFDKTGTLTTGKFMCKAIEPIHGHWDEGDSSCCNPSCENEALAVAAAMEKGTTHPIGRAVVDHSIGKDLPNIFVETFESLPGRGLSASLTRINSGNGSCQLLNASLGSVEYIASLCKSIEESEKIKAAANISTYGNTFVQAALSVSEKVTLFHFEDEPRPGVSDVISTLREKGKFQLKMLTGDHESSAWRVAKAVGIYEVYSSLKPEDKLNHVKKSSINAGGGLIMVGDGINDAPALAAATVGIVLAQRASATAIAVADVLLLQDNISCVPFCIAKARQTSALVKQSVILALSCIVFASYQSVLGFLPLWLTVKEDVPLDNSFTKTLSNHNCLVNVQTLLDSIMDEGRPALNTFTTCVLLHEGGTLLVCLNSIRALNEPTWSWQEDLWDLFGRMRCIFTKILAEKAAQVNFHLTPL